MVVGYWSEIYGRLKLAGPPLFVYVFLMQPVEHRTWLCCCSLVMKCLHRSRHQVKLRLTNHKWFSVTCNMGVWGLKPTWALCVLPPLDSGLSNGQWFWFRFPGCAFKDMCLTLEGGKFWKGNVMLWCILWRHTHVQLARSWHQMFLLATYWTKMKHYLVIKNLSSRITDWFFSAKCSPLVLVVLSLDLSDEKIVSYLTRKAWPAKIRAGTFVCDT